MVCQGLALRRRSLYHRLRAIAEYDYTRRPEATLILTPSVWEQRLTARFCMELNLGDCYVAAESRDALERRDLRLWCHPSFVFGSSYHTLETVSSHGSPNRRLFTESPSRKRASIPDPELMVQAAPNFGISPAEKRTLDLVTDHPMIPREHLSRWLGVSEGRVSQMTHSLVDTWGLVERRGRRGDTRYTLSSATTETMFAIETLITNQPATSTAPMVWSRHLPLSSLNSVEPTLLMQPSFNSQGSGTSPTIQ